MMWLVFPELQKVVGEFYFRVLGEVNRISGKNVDLKHQNRMVGSGFFGNGMCGGKGQKSAVEFF
jgi:hypothetical protein